jgi:hypothetical protein
MTRAKRRASFRVLRPCGINRCRSAEVALIYGHGLSRRAHRLMVAKSIKPKQGM